MPSNAILEDLDVLDDASPVSLPFTNPANGLTFNFWDCDTRPFNEAYRGHWDVVPEPSTALLMGRGLAGLALRRDQLPLTRSRTWCCQASGQVNLAPLCLH